MMKTVYDEWADEDQGFLVEELKNGLAECCGKPLNATGFALMTGWITQLVDSGMTVTVTFGAIEVAEVSA